MYNILVCDDEKDIVSALEIYLTSEGYRVFTAANGKEALNVIRKEDVHLVLLDVMMPEMDGITAMVEIRKLTNIPVILLTAKSEDNDKILGLNIGADDYITKPFNPIEVMARVKSQLRRYMSLGGGSVKPSVLTVGGIELDDNAKIVTVDGRSGRLNADRIRHIKAVYGKHRHRFFAEGYLPSGVERFAGRRGGNGGRTYPPSA